MAWACLLSPPWFTGLINCFLKDSKRRKRERERNEGGGERKVRRKIGRKEERTKRKKKKRGEERKEGRKNNSFRLRSSVHNVFSPKWWIKLYWKQQSCSVVDRKRVNTSCATFFCCVWIWRIIFQGRSFFHLCFFSYITTVVEWDKKFNLLCLQHTRLMLEHFTFIYRHGKSNNNILHVSKTRIFLQETGFTDGFFYLDMNCRLRVTCMANTPLMIGTNFK